MNYYHINDIKIDLLKPNVKLNSLELFTPEIIVRPDHKYDTIYCNNQYHI